ncbi:hypothetical protein BC831DRAFT_460347 [Entophlyctis helioformis]|nr:hypothetical protein BC831DRAFT_460347 [Entophlyctis helioformis]
MRRRARFGAKCDKRQATSSLVPIIITDLFIGLAVHCHARLGSVGAVQHGPWSSVWVDMLEGVVGRRRRRRMVVMRGKRRESMMCRRRLVMRVLLLLLLLVIQMLLLLLLMLVLLLLLERRMWLWLVMVGMGCSNRSSSRAHCVCCVRCVYRKTARRSTWQGLSHRQCPRGWDGGRCRCRWGSRRRRSAIAVQEQRCDAGQPQSGCLARMGCGMLILLVVVVVVVVLILLVLILLVLILLRLLLVVIKRARRISGAVTPLAVVSASQIWLWRRPVVGVVGVVGLVGLVGGVGVVGVGHIVALGLQGCAWVRMVARVVLSDMGRQGRADRAWRVSPRGCERRVACAACAV